MRQKIEFGYGPYICSVQMFCQAKEKWRIWCRLPHHQVCAYLVLCINYKEEMKTTHKREYHIKPLPKNTVYYRDEKKTLMLVFGQSWWGIRWIMLSKDGYLCDITAKTDIFFGLLFHLFLRTKILKSAVTSLMNWYIISLIKLTVLHQVSQKWDCWKLKKLHLNIQFKYCVSIIC